MPTSFPVSEKYLSDSPTFEGTVSREAVFSCPQDFLEHPDFERKIASLVCVYSIEVCENEIGRSHEHYSEYREFLFVCLRFHAGQAIENEPIEIDVLIGTLQEGCSPVDGSPLGGNPLRDGVLAVAMLLKNDPAIFLFEKDYSDYLRGIAYRVHPRFGNDPDEWWNEFLDFLAGYSHPNGKLRKYQGKCALRPWLRVVIWNFLRRRPLYHANAEITEDVSVPDSNTENIERAESIAVFNRLVRDSVLAMPKRDRLLLSMIYIDNMRKKNIAAVFQVHPGQIGRWEETAIARFREELVLRLENLRDKYVQEEMLRGIVSSPKEFALTLAEVLTQLRTEGEG